MSYQPYERADFFAHPAGYLQPTASYDFYQPQQTVPPPLPPPDHLEPVIPYGWRADWSRGPHDWSQTVHLQPPPLQPQPHPIDGSFCSNTYLNINDEKPLIYKPLISEPINKPFRCQLCGKSFSQAANLTAHKRVHTGEKPFACSVCNRPFSQSSSLVTHRRTHTGERPYPCKHCDKAFTDSSTLTKHLRTHTGNKPYACKTCAMRFTQSGNLHRHMKTHSK